MNSQELLRHVLRGDAVTAEMIDQLLGDKVEEDQWLEYKRGAWLDGAPKDRNPKLKRYVSAFANADGGVLLVGIAGSEGDPPNWIVDGCPSKGVGDPATWAADVLRTLAPYLVPPPRIQAVPHPNGTVLVVGADRAPSLVPVAESPQVQHFLRVYNQVVEVPSFLYADLVLGRRARPNIELSIRLSGAKNENAYWGNVALDLAAENAGIVWADDVRLGVIGYAERNHMEESSQRVTLRPVTETLRRQLDVREVTSNVLLGLWDAASATLAPFERMQARTNLILPGMELPMLWLAAAFAIPRNGPPTWAQLSIEITGERRSSRGTIRPLPQGERPVIHWGRLDQYIDAEEQDR